MTKPLVFWSLTVGNNHHQLFDPPTFDEILDEFFKQWCYQGELGTTNRKAHYQVRCILDTPQTKATMLHCLHMRGIPLEDLTFSPESNKSIEQGGLAFYVMDSTKDVWLPMRCDSSFQPPRARDWIPEQCWHIRDTPRPWMTTLTDIIRGPPDHRAILWICTLEGKGGVAKSGFNTYVEASGMGKYLGAGTPLQIQEACISDGEHRCYTLDLPKTFASDNKLGDYVNALEIVKNGFIKTGMHGKRKRLMMNIRPHEIVFCNILPPFHLMTDGRFIVYTIDPGKPPEAQTLDRWAPNPGLPRSPESFI